nr:glycoside hydrolase family 30 beta sandwich domain-containing protein [uncultured Blautia sp.]
MKRSMVKMIRVIGSLMMILSLSACGTDSPEPATTTVNGIPRVYLSVPDENIKFVRQTDDMVKVYDISELDRDSGIIVNVNADKTYQNIEGFGAAITESTAHNLYLLPEEERNSIMKKCFDAEEGLGLSFLRQPLGGSDFVREYYSYDEMPEGEEDYELTHFSIEHDKEQIIPLVKQAIAINPEIRLVGSVWSAPLWMKDKREWTSKNKAQIRLECYEAYANYIVKSLKAWEAEGLPFYAVTPSNEPTGVHDIPGNYFTAANMTRLVNNYLRPAIDESGLSTKLWCWDFSYFEDDALAFLTPTLNAVDGIAFHSYAGKASLMGDIHKMFPELSIFVTEAAGQPQPARTQLFRQMNWIDEALRNHASGYFLWNILLDQNRGPQPEGADIQSSGLFQLNTETMKVDPYMDFYALGHYSKFIRPGAKVVDSTDTGTQTNGEHRNTVAINENGSMTAVISNRTVNEAVYKLIVGDKVIEYTLQPQSVATIVWNANVYEEGVSA